MRRSILFIGLVDAGFVRVPIESIPIVNGRAAAQPQPPVTLGDLTGWPIFLAVFGLLLTTLLLARQVRGALIVGILATTVLGIVIHYAAGGQTSQDNGQAHCGHHNRARQKKKRRPPPDP